MQFIWFNLQRFLFFSLQIDAKRTHEVLAVVDISEVAMGFFGGQSALAVSLDGVGRLLYLYKEVFPGE
jgi:hypothetical protein